MAKKRTNVLITIELEGATGNEKEDLPSVAQISGQAHDSVDTEMKGRPKSTTISITGTDTLSATVTSALAAIDALTGVP